MKKMLALIFILFLVAGCSEQPRPAATSQAVPVTAAPSPTAVPEAATTAAPLPTLTGSEGGLIAFYSERDGDAEIYVIHDDGSDETQLTDNQVDDVTPAWSPDGQLIAFVSTDKGNEDIYVMNADGSDRRRLTDHPANENHPSYSPDGAQIVFVSDRDGDMEIYVMDSDGRNPQRLTQSAAGDMHPDWSPDGRQILFNSERDGNWEIYVMDSDGGNQRPLTQSPAWDLFPTWSPDGTRILYFSLVQGKEKQDIYRMNADGTDVQRLTNSPNTVDEDPAWSPDGRQIAFQSDREGQFEIYLMDVEGNNQRRLTNGLAGAYWPAWNPGSFGYEESQVLPSFYAPPGDPAIIDGAIYPGEWDKALTIDLAYGQLLLMHAGDYLYLGIRSERLGLGSPCVQWADKISILHASAALGTATYEKERGIWQKTRDFSWTNRDTSNSQQALEERQEHLERENWLASNGLMGPRNEMEYQIAMTNGEVLLGVAYLMSPEYESTDYWPETLGPGCRNFTPAPEGLPETVDFAPETWMTVLASDTPVAASMPATGPAECPEGLSIAACTTLQSLRQVDDYPLYTMHYAGAYDQADETEAPAGRNTPAGRLTPEAGPAWGCSLFAAYADGEDGHFGRNFDWRFSPAVLLFTDPPGGYASVSMVDIAYLVAESEIDELDTRPLEARLPLLDAPFWPFDGMNEYGLAVGMAAVPAGQVAPDLDKESIDSLLVMRKMLDGARNVDQAVAIFTGYNIDMGGGPPLHYLVADASGRSVLLEFYQGELVILPGERTWQQMTNFLRASAGETAEGQCWRYDRIGESLSEREGSLSGREAVELLADVAQDNTQWSIVYGLTTGKINVTMGRQYDTVYSFRLDGNFAGTP